MHFRVMGHVELFIIRLLLYKILTKHFLSLTVKIIANTILFLCARHIILTDHILWIIDILWALSGSIYDWEVHQLYYILCISLTLFYVIVILVSILIMYVFIFHVHCEAELYHIIFIMKIDNALENINDTLTLMASLLLLISGDVHPNPGPNPNIYNDFSLCHLNIRSLSKRQAALY